MSHDTAYCVTEHVPLDAQLRRIAWISASGKLTPLAFGKPPDLTAFSCKRFEPQLFRTKLRKPCTPTYRRLVLANLDLSTD